MITIGFSTRKTNPEFVHPVHKKYKALDYEQTIAILIKANQELNERITKLENNGTV